MAVSATRRRLTDVIGTIRKLATFAVAGATATFGLVALTTGGTHAATPAVATTTTSTTVPLSSVHVKLTKVVSGLVEPTAIAWRPGDSRMYVAEQTGRVRIVDKGLVVGTSLTVTVSGGNEQGLLGLTFSRDGTKMYVDFTDVNGDTHVVEYPMIGDKADVAHRRLLIFQKQPYANHNGGQVTIGPDNLLYIAFGDGGSAGDPQGNGQKLSTWLGKILRIDPRPTATKPYGIPPTNPFVGQTAVKPEIYMYGLRNPWRFSIDRATHDFWIGDVGQASYEEVDYAPAGQAGQNWEWNLREGFHAYLGARPPGGRDPILERPHTLGDCAITGGYVYRGSVIPALRGAYVFGDFCTGEIRAVTQSAGKVTQNADLNINVAQLTTFGEGTYGELYAASRTGTIYRVAPA